MKVKKLHYVSVEICPAAVLLDEHTILEKCQIIMRFMILSRFQNGTVLSLCGALCAAEGLFWTGLSSS